MCNEDDVSRILQGILERVDTSSPTAEDHKTSEIVATAIVEGVGYAVVRLDDSEPFADLSPRESEIVRLVAEGMPNKGIAEILDISPWTVATHIRRIFTKLGVHSRAHMVACYSDELANQGTLAKK